MPRSEVEKVTLISCVSGRRQTTSQNRATQQTKILAPSDVGFMVWLHPSVFFALMVAVDDLDQRDGKNDRHQNKPFGAGAAQIPALPE